MENLIKEMVFKFMSEKVGTVKAIEFVTPDKDSVNPFQQASGQEKVVAKFNDPKQEDIEVFLKTCKENTVAHSINKVLFTFDKEIYFYENILPRFQTILVSSNVMNDFFVKNYGSDKINNDVYIALENFVAKDFHVTVREELHNLPLILNVIKKLAIFHACYFKCDPNESKKWENYLNETEIFQPKNHPMLSSLFVDSYKKSLKVMKAIVDESGRNDILAKHNINTPNGDLVNQLMNVSDDVLNIYYHLSTRKSKFYSLCHGDFHMWNIAIRQNQFNQSSLKFFDFQIVRFASSCTDILQYLYQVSSPQFRKDNLQAILNEYCNSFNNILKDSNAEKVISEDDLLAEYKNVSPWGFLYGFTFLLPRFLSQDFYTKLDALTDSKDIIELLVNEATTDEVWNILNYYVDMVNEVNELGTIRIMQETTQNKK